MKAVILAAGKGTRLGSHTANLPKAMLDIHGRSLLERQMEVLHECGVDSISVVGGYHAEKLRCHDSRRYINPDFAETNMVETLFCAREEFTDDILVCYGDVLYTPEVLTSLLQAPGDILVTVDKDWRNYWLRRYGTVETDTESLSLAENGLIESVGKPDVPASEIDARYVGLLKITRAGLAIAMELYDRERARHWNKPWGVSGKCFQQAYMTDFIQALIDEGNPVHSHVIHRGWIEFDNADDYELGKIMLEASSRGVQLVA